MKASGEVDDSLKGVTERSILLDDSRPQQRVHQICLRRGWGQWMAAAAIVLLCLALGMIVYKTVRADEQAKNTAVQVDAVAATTRGIDGEQGHCARRW